MERGRGSGPGATLPEEPVPSGRCGFPQMQESPMKVVRLLLVVLALTLSGGACSGEITGPRPDSSPVLGSGS